ncbi:hypothetical protein [Pontibacter cellulosilyticus]|uniref:Uncharacterized protein n=1 Tax=Pontibacter cellulosilyticus TaxID=1720253 RepID=A0A923N8C5_9BACT|nr:hypothetical protein [Pontibacter cellulosilyticus]MBC5992330.1 hypothetical protein [Pontibacter cellulosilyticus]
MKRDYHDHNYGRGRHNSDWDNNYQSSHYSRDRHRDSEGRYEGGGSRHYRHDDDQNYRHRDYDMERDYYSHVGNSHHDLDNIRQGYGIPSFGNSSDSRYSEIEEMKRERDSQRMQGYGSGRLGGYSGSAFGGSNYSSHGDFGGSSEYGAMSGYGGNSDHDVSSSGYGGGNYSGQSPRSLRDNENYRYGRGYRASQRDSDRNRGRRYYNNESYRIDF